MSIINKMLQDLDRRQGMSDPDANLVTQHVRTVAPSRKDREWFWRIIAVLMIASVGWVAWIAWQLRAREPVATDQALKAAQNAPRNAPAAQPAIEQKPAAEKPAPEIQAPAPETEKPAPQSAEPLKLAQGIKAPVVEQPRRPARATQPKPSAPPTARLDLDLPPALILQAPAQTAARVEKRDRARTVEDRAEAEFRRGATLLNQGRAGEAEESFGTALSAYPGHEAARQALVAMHLEQRRIDEARRLLQEGVALNPANARFASVLARIFIERQDYAAALEVVNGVRVSEQASPELQSARGTALQRLGRHAEAADAFQASLRSEPQNGAAWVGFGISLESLGRKSEAAEAFRRAAATGTLSTEVRGYAEQRARQLQ